MKHRKSQGFSIVEALIVIVLVAVLALGGWLVWRHNHQAKKTAVTTAGKTEGPATKQTPTNQLADPYVGWKTYCDYYNYCFKYPTNWKLTVQTIPQQPGAAGQITLTNPDGTVELSYMNVNNHDGAVASYVPAIASVPLPSANPSLSLIGGYMQLGSSYYPAYDIVDTSLLTTYPLIVGQETQIPQPPQFTDQGKCGKGCSGSFEAVPSKPLSTLVDAKARFASADAQISQLILRSLTYQQ